MTSDDHPDNPSSNLPAPVSNKLEQPSSTALATLHVNLSPEDTRHKLRKLNRKQLKTSVWGTKSRFKTSLRPGIGGVEVRFLDDNKKETYGLHIRLHRREYGTEIAIGPSRKFAKLSTKRIVAKHILTYAFYGSMFLYLTLFSYPWFAMLAVLAAIAHTSTTQLSAIQVAERELPALVQDLFADEIVADPHASPGRR